ncbi:hypothetical protein DAEQUDRAFT_767869 [Daedalea quercina L-15889]|uniref:Uncharacterized protein n=1 Tax=Daedalea quercina L-15889 TaxID=1314783 RepID=A0A165N8G6_9APHY|nr:hypothetical protein DAEQUDRAFT_767869 [Daedalea quercina L-15889]
MKTVGGQRFLHDVKSAASLTHAGRLKAVAVLPLGLAGIVVSAGWMYSMKKKKVSSVGELIDQWNMHFFHLRWLTVILAKGSDAYNGPNGIGPPDMMNWDEDKSSDSSGPDIEGHTREDHTHSNRAKRGGRVGERRAARGKRIDGQRRSRRTPSVKERNKHRQDRRRLIIAYQPEHDV